MPSTPSVNLNTFSIVAYDPASGMFGVATSTKFPAVGVLVPYARSGVGAIATQARVNPLLGYDGLDLLERGHTAEETLRILLDSDPDPEKRQVGIVDSRGSPVTHTGTQTDRWRGHLVGTNYAVMGNLLVGEEVVVAMSEAYAASLEEPFAERLMRALEAGQAVGGDKRGSQSAAIRIVEDRPYPYLDLRVDEHSDPVVELRRIYEVANTEILALIEALPTRTNPKGDFGEEIQRILLPER